MREDYHKWYSQWIGEDFEMLVFGDAGIPLILFPYTNSKYYEYKDYGVIDSLSELIYEEKVKIYCPDSRDYQHWLNYDIEPAERVLRYIQFEKLVLNDVVKFINYETEENNILFGGFGLGGYHALNLSLKHPELSRGFISMGAPTNIKRFVYGYYDENCYYNNPSDYLPGMTDEKLLSQIRKLKIILCSGISDPYDFENQDLSKQFFIKGVNHLSDVKQGKINTYDDCQILLGDNLPLLL